MIGLLHRLSRICVATTAFALAASSATAQVPTFRSLATPTHTLGSAEIVTDISADGRVVIYGSADEVSILGSFAWSEGVTVPIQDCSGAQSDGSNVRGISGDGTAIVGACNSTTLGITGMRTVSNLSFVPVNSPAVDPLLNNLGTALDSRARATSGDGSVIVGWASSSSILLSGGLETEEAFHWANSNSPQMTGLGFLPGDNRSRAYDVSANGLVIVGRSADGSSRAEAVRWIVDANGVVQSMDPLGDLQPVSGPISSAARAVSPNGENVVGEARTTPGSPDLEPFLWTLSSGSMLRLGGRQGEHIIGTALAVSGDGSVVVGSMESAPGTFEAFVWTAGTGVQSIQSLLATPQGVADAVTGAPIDLSQWSLISASGISEGGTLISGHGINPLGVNEPWLIHLVVPEPGTSLLLAAVLAGVAQWSRGSKQARGTRRCNRRES